MDNYFGWKNQGNYPSPSNGSSFVRGYLCDLRWGNIGDYRLAGREIEQAKENHQRGKPRSGPHRQGTSFLNLVAKFGNTPLG